MKHFLVFVCLLLFVVAPVSADSEILDNRWVYYGDTFEQENTVYYIETANNNDRLLLYADDDPFIIIDGTCKENVKLHEKYCIEEAAYSDPDTYKAYIKYAHGEELFGFRLVTKTLVPELKVTRSMSPSKAEYETQSTITITFENEGEKAIQNILYEENISDSLNVFPIDATKTSQGVQYTLNSLAPGSSRTFQYGVMPTDYVTVSLTPKVSYSYDSLKKTASVSALSLNVAQPFTITESKKFIDVSINTATTYEITLENDASSSLSYSTTITLPEGARVDDFSNVLYGADELTLTGKEVLRANEEESFSFSLRAPKTGTYPVTVEMIMQVDGKTITRYYYPTLVVAVDPLRPRIQFSRVDNAFRSGEKATVRAYAENINERISYTNLKGTLKSDFFSHTITSEGIAPQEEQLIKEFSITAPIVTQKTPKTLTFAGTYTTRENEEFSFTTALPISILPNSDAVAITQKPNVTTVVAGEVVKMTVSLKNDAGKYISFTAKDTFSNAAKVLSGTTQSKQSLEKDASAQAYIYELQIPVNATPGEFIITTTVSSTDFTFPASKTTTLTIQEPPQEEGEEKITQEGEQEFAEQERKEGFLSKAWKWVVNFFS